MKRNLLEKRRIGISTIAIVIIVVVIIAIAGVGAYVLTIKPSTTSTTTTTSTTCSGAGCAGPVTLVGAGSTLVGPAMQGWTYNFSLIYPNVRLTYSQIGSGGGVTAITDGTVNFGASDAPLSAAQYGNSTSGLASKRILQIPEIAGGVVPAYNLGSTFTTHLNFNGTVLADIYLGTITMWNDPAIQALNPGVTLPDHQIITVHRSDGSGTTYVFTDYLSDSSATFNSTIGKGTSVSWCGSGNNSPNCGSTIIAIGSKGSTGVTGYISGNEYTLGYVETVYAAQASLLYGAVQNAAGVFVLANSTTTAAAVAAAASATFPNGTQSWASVSIVDLLLKNTTATNAYPLATFTYIMVYQNQATISGVSQGQALALASFLYWIINNQNNAQTYAANLGYVALPPKIVAIDDASILSMNYNGKALLTNT